MAFSFSYFKIDCRELDAFAKQLGEIPKKKEKERKQFIRKQGSALRRVAVKEANARVRKTAVVRRRNPRPAGKFHKSIKRGKWYRYGDGADCIRVYSSDKIAHIIDRGWTPKLRDRSQGDPVAGKEVFSSASDSFEPKFYLACDRFAAGYKGEIER